jgi:hypothetical protein
MPIYNECYIYRKHAERFRKQINNGLPKREAGQYYSNGLEHNCKQQCENYKVRKDSKGQRFFICDCCLSKFTSLAFLDAHQRLEHIDICKWRKRKQIPIPSSIEISLLEFYL